MKINFKNATGRAALVILLAVAILIGISFLPLERWTGGSVKNFNLFSDILNIEINETTDSVGDTESIDPELLKALKETENGNIPLADEINDSPGLSAPSAVDTSVIAYVDTDTVVQPVKPCKQGSTVVIEDYTTGNIGLARLKAAINSGRLARIAFVGDSYIEGDIFTQNLRENLQNAYGGEGVGYVNMHSDFPGFRRSVKQGGSGWKSFTAIKKAKKEYMFISEEYCIPTGQALSTYHGVNTLAHLDKWSRSRFLFIAPNNTTVSVKTNGEWETHDVKGSTGVQSILVNGITDEFSVKTADTNLIGLGVWLDGTTGVSLDCMSSRGFSGITLTNISAGLCRAMSADVNYDLIILEFGINAMSASQTNYSVYADRMVKVINHMRTCYPNADILLMGIGDRGQKKGAEVHSMSTVPNMINAQRDVARRTHCLFWDTREAMGGQDAIVSWAQQKLANKDYIHLTHEGGKRLGDLLFNALQIQLKK